MSNLHAQQHSMNRALRNDFFENVLIGLSYMLLWAPAVFIMANLDSTSFREMYLYRTWMNIYVFFFCLFIFHVLFVHVQQKKNRLLWITLSIVLISLLLVVGYIQWLKFGMKLHTYPASERFAIDNSYIVRSVIYQLYGIAYFTTIKLWIRFQKLKTRNQQLLLEKKTSELNFLKSQTNPHFLFNTLNGIYALAREKSDLTADTVMRLSDILRYMLYETQASLTTIGKEIEIMDEYIELEKMRFDENLILRFKKNIDNPDQPIPPLLLVHLIENAFKHGAAETIHTPSISIDLTLQNYSLLFSIENSTGAGQLNDESKETIGLNNLRRQLELLFDEQELLINQTDHSFVVSLKINLKSYAQN